MKRKKFEKMMEPYLETIAQICRDFEAPLDRIDLVTTLGKSARLRGDAGKVCILLNDTQPGWRKDDNPEVRRLLKQAVRRSLAEYDIPVSVAIYANYSKLAVEDGVTYRKDSQGNVVGRSGE